MSDQFVGEVRCVGFNFAPVGWAECDGQLLAISQNTALFSLLGTFYGGNGTSNFGLPNLQGNVAIGQGNGPGLSQRFIGETGGEQNVTLLQTEMPLHRHNYMVDFGDGPAGIGTPNTTAAVSFGPMVYTASTSPAVPMANSALAITGQSFPHNNMMQYLVLNFVIAMQGIFPQRA
jgi:microcystin-dependent protein